MRVRNLIFYGKHYFLKILNTMARAMNFSIELYESSDTETAKWGRLQSNGSATGLLGEMVIFQFVNQVRHKSFPCR